MSDSNTSAVAFVREPAWGVPPVAPGMQLLRILKETLEYDKATEMSAEIRSDRQRSESALVGVGAKGGVDFELSVGSFDGFLEAALMGTWTNDVLKNGKTRYSYTMEKQTLETGGYQYFYGMMLDTLNLSLTSRKIITGSFGFLGRGGGEAATSMAARRTGTLTFTGQPADGETVTVGAKVYTFQAALVNAAGNVKIGATTAASIANLVAAINLDPAGTGTQYAAATVVNPDFAAASGVGTTVVVSEIVPGGAPVLTTTDTVANATWGGAVAVAGPGYAAAATGLILTSSANVGNVKEGGLVVSGLKNLSLTVNNNLRGNDEIGRLDFGEIGLGECAVSGKVDAYFRTRTLLTKFIKHQASSISFEVQREAPGAVVGDVVGYRITIPKLRYPKGMPTIPGKNTDIMLPLEFEAEADDVTGCTIQVERLKKTA